MIVGSRSHSCSRYRGEANRDKQNREGEAGIMIVGYRLLVSRVTAGGASQQLKQKMSTYERKNAQLLLTLCINIVAPPVHGY